MEQDRSQEADRGEPLYVLGYNGYYPNGDTTQPLTKEGVTYSTESATAPTIGDCTVVTDITVPLDGISQTYVNNVYLYVDAMKNLNGEVSADEDIFLGVDAKVKIYAEKAENVVTLPAGVVNIGKDGSFCYVLKDGVITRQDITTGISSEDAVEVTDGITAGLIVLAICFFISSTDL